MPNWTVVFKLHGELWMSIPDKATEDEARDAAWENLVIDTNDREEMPLDQNELEIDIARCFEEDEQEDESVTIKDAVDFIHFMCRDKDGNIPEEV